MKPLKTADKATYLLSHFQHNGITKCHRKFVYRYLGLDIALCHPHNCSALILEQITIVPLMSENGMEMELISKLLIYLALIKFTISTGLVIYGRICRGIGLEKKNLYY